MTHPIKRLALFLLPAALLPAAPVFADPVPTTAAPTVPVALERPLSGPLHANTQYLFNPQIFGVWARSDDQSSVADPGTNIPSAVSIEQYFGGRSVNDGRNSLGVALHMEAATAAANSYRYYAAGNFVADSAVNDHGSPGAAKGSLYGIGGVCRLKRGATYWHACIPGDFEVSWQAGSSGRTKAIVATLEWPDDAVQGDLVDAHLWSSASTGAVGMSNGWQIDNNAGAAPITAGGTLVKASGGWTISNGFDLSGIVIKDWLLKGSGIIETSSKTPATSTSTGAARIHGGLGVGGAGYFGGPVILPTFTIAELPACTGASRGARANVANGEARPQFMAKVATTGKTFAPVFCNGIAWQYG